MRALPFLAFGVLASAGLAACSDVERAAQARTALDCPAKAGPLSRVSETADARTCEYADSMGDKLELKLLAVSGGPDAALTPIETELQAQYPSPLGRAPAAKSSDDDDDDDDGANAATGTTERHEVDLPGVHIVASGDKATVDVAGVHVNANGGGAVVRTAREVKMRGNPFVLARNGYRASYQIAREAPVDGYVLVGYEAGGPRKGPLTVAVIRATGHDHEVFAAGKKLVGRNGGV